MSNREFTATRTMLANAFATAGAELLDYMNTAAALAAIPNTDPPRYVVAGTLAMIAKVLPSADAPAAATVLTDERIAELNRQAQDQGISGIAPSIYLARAVEREVLAHAGVTAEPAEPEHMSTDESREYLVKFMEQHFTDKTFHRYIRGQIGGSGPLAGDFAWQMARALRMILAAPTIPAQVPAAEVRAQALEEAARICETRLDPSRSWTTSAAAYWHASEIRSFAHQSTADKASEVRAARHPVQPLVIAERGRIRFKRNHIVEHLAEGKLNDLATMGFPQEDWEQLAQLIGYSLDGFGTLSYVTDETYERAAAQEPIAAPSTADSANTGALGEKGAEA